MNRQGPDRGTQYRTGIFFHSTDQEKVALTAIERHQPKWQKKITTEVTPATTFYRAEEYHQQYFEKNGVSHCRLPVVCPGGAPTPPSSQRRGPNPPAPVS